MVDLSHGRQTLLHSWISCEIFFSGWHRSDSQTKAPSRSVFFSPFPPKSSFSGSRVNLVNSKLQLSSSNPEDQDSTPVAFKQEDFVIGKLIGKGTYGQVYSCTLKSSGGTYAMKTLSFPSSVTAEDREQILYSLEKELEVLGTLKHKNVVSLFGYVRTSSQLSMIMNLFDSSLSGVIEKRHQQRRQSGCSWFTWTEITHFATMILEGISYLHDHELSHTDLKVSWSINWSLSSLVSRTAWNCSDLFFLQERERVGLPSQWKYNQISSRLRLPRSKTSGNVESFQGKFRLAGSRWTSFPSISITYFPLCTEATGSHYYFNPYAADSLTFFNLTLWHSKFHSAVFSFGLMLYELIIGPRKKRTVQQVNAGEVPEIPEEVSKLSDGSIELKKLISLYEYCTKLNPKERLTAEQSLSFLKFGWELAVRLPSLHNFHHYQMTFFFPSGSVWLVDSKHPREDLCQKTVSRFRMLTLVNTTTATKWMMK